MSESGGRKGKSIVMLWPLRLWQAGSWEGVEY
jgi:hypothetical protein